MGRAGLEVQPCRAGPIVSKVYRPTHDRLVFSEVTLSGTTAAETSSFVPPIVDGGMGRCHTRNLAAATRVLAAV